MIFLKIQLIIFFIFSGLSVFAQNATPDLLTEIGGIVYIKKTSELFTGKYTENYPQENIIGKEGTYQNGKMIGKWTWYYKDGKVKRESEYFNNQKNGKTIYWFKDGKKQSETHYKNDCLDGKAVWYHQNEKKKKEAIYNNGKFVSGKEWDENGKIINGSFSIE
ncbi:MAG: hypothetical protein A2046_15235 [Bacteroidetes bacterium GWA2_30_7]|nr:MAG: hypothetical protein A2046_15235 [Bacteroidetes bacterium GWA2_30_7]